MGRTTAFDRDGAATTSTSVVRPPLFALCGGVCEIGWSRTNDSRVESIVFQPLASCLELPTLAHGSNDVDGYTVRAARRQSLVAQQHAAVADHDLVPVALC